VGEFFGQVSVQRSATTWVESLCFDGLAKVFPDDFPRAESKRKNI
jgi:hypothetical protein